MSSMEKINDFLDNLSKVLENIKTDHVSDGKEKVLSVNELGIVTAVNKYPENVVSIFKNQR